MPTPKRGGHFEHSGRLSRLSRRGGCWLTAVLRHRAKPDYTTAKPLSAHPSHTPPLAHLKSGEWYTSACAVPQKEIHAPAAESRAGQFRPRPLSSPTPLAPLRSGRPNSSTTAVPSWADSAGH